MVENPRNPLHRFFNSVVAIVDGPITFFREKIVTPNQKHYPYYHQIYQRVPTIDECYTHDEVCKFEAQHQFLRDMNVDSEILSILRQRYEHCNFEDINQRGEEKCEVLYDIYKENAANWFAKYGDLGPYPDVVFAFSKQKHRLVWERRHGPVGTGMKEDPYKVEDPEKKEAPPVTGAKSRDSYW
ncbi:hypothetical protein QAD02_006058 [Eretmocerus hayati]|uniref:Uncharacterized protein n=1 Tax=Eretmocerus hayati TaxID=131215 RepID=A0ACC2N0N0_9HYME|nr:hypothetical protein QAD02_006058 [Eretmocerus hayati]